MIEDPTPMFTLHQPSGPICAGESDETVPKVKTVKELDKEYQPRERARDLGVGALRLDELFALILRTGLPGVPITLLSQRLMEENGHNLHQLERRSREELLEYPGIGLTKAIQIEAVMELIRRYTSELPMDMPVGGDPEKLADLIRPKIGNLDHEEIWAILLNRANRVIRLHRLSMGGIAATVFDVKMLMKRVLLDQASGLVLCHNHPSGNLVPSREDDHITKLCAEACKTLDVRFLDHVIVNSHPTEYFSYYNTGRL